MASQRPAHDSWRRAESALRAVLPWSVKVRRERRDNAPDLLINGLPIEVKWVGKGWLRDVQHIVATRRNRPDVVAARHMSPGAREVLSKAGIGWVDETGAAEIVLGPIVISPSGTLETVHEDLSRWNH